MTLTLYAYPPSVYCHIVRMALAECGVTDCRSVSVDPFSDDPANPHPFGRVPFLDHDGFRLYETRAITAYLDAQFAGGAFTPDNPKGLARMNQVISLVDAYAYWPLVRQVFSHGVFRPREGLASDPAEIAAGLDKAKPVLAALDKIASEGRVLNRDRVSLADIHLAPVIGYFTAMPEAARMLPDFTALNHWWCGVSMRASYDATRSQAVGLANGI